MLSAKTTCWSCGHSFYVTANSDVALQSSLRKKKYCPTCAEIKHRESVKNYRKTHPRKKPKKKYVEETFSLEDFDRAYVKFFAKRGIDVSQEVTFNRGRTTL